MHARGGKFSIKDLPALTCTSNLHEPHQNKNHSITECEESWTKSFSIKFADLDKILLIVNMDKIPFHGFADLDKVPFTVCRLVNLSQFGQRVFCPEGILSRHQVNYLKSHICRSLPILYHTVVTHLLASDLTSAAVLIRVIKLSDN